MKTLVIRAVLAVVLVCALDGCALFKNPDAAFVAGVDAGLNAGPANAAILDKYDAYVDADTKLTADTKRIEHRTTAALRKLVADAKAK
jgi:predicted lipoprotein